jgi:hypothetical protein
MPAAQISADDIIRELAMQPHPEGGWYVQTFRDAQGGARGHSTAIYYLLKSGSARTGTASTMPLKSGTTTPEHRWRFTGPRTAGRSKR